MDLKFKISLLIKGIHLVTVKYPWADVGLNCRARFCHRHVASVTVSWMGALHIGHSKSWAQHCWQKPLWPQGINRMLARLSKQSVHESSRTDTFLSCSSLICLKIKKNIYFIMIKRLLSYKIINYTELNYIFVFFIKTVKCNYFN